MQVTMLQKSAASTRHMKSFIGNVSDSVNYEVPVYSASFRN
eukprot:XP_001704553.1 Hypothetical protein GL50803_26847 [Giardia lamblia ATCC 50803]